MPQIAGAPSALLCLAAALSGTACDRNVPLPTAESPIPLSIRARDFAYDAPDAIRSSVVNLKFVNDGPGYHHVQIVRVTRCAREQCGYAPATKVRMSIMFRLRD